MCWTLPCFDVNGKEFQRCHNLLTASSYKEPVKKLGFSSQQVKEGSNEANHLKNKYLANSFIGAISFTVN